MKRFTDLKMMLISVVCLLGMTQVAVAATEFTEDFSGGLPSYMELGQACGFPLVTIDFSGGNAEFSAGDGSRRYIRTNISDYNQVSFVFEGTTIVGVGAWGAPFFGLGKGDTRADFYCEPTRPTIRGSLWPTANNSGFSLSSEPNPDGTGGTSHTITGVAGDGMHRVRLVWDALTRSAYAQIDQNYAGGEFVVDATTSELTIFTLSASNSCIYFGGGNSVVWDDVSVRFILTLNNPIPSKGAVNIDPAALMSWDSTTFLANAVYEISIGTDPNCNNIIANQSTGSFTQFNPAGLLDYASTYYWSVKATGDKGAGDSLTTLPMVFTTGGKVASHRPVEGSIAGPQTNLTWTGSGLAAKYRVYFALKGQPLVELAKSPYTSAVVPNADLPVLADGATYEWRVDEADIVGNAFLPGDIMSFTVGVSNSPLTNGLILHLDAGKITGLNDGDPVSNWQDFSGNFNGATQLNSAWKPTYTANAVNGRPAVSFDAADDDMSTPLILNAPYTVFAVFNGRNATEAHRAIAGSNNWLIGPYSGGINHYANGWVSNGVVKMNVGQYYITAAINNTSASKFIVDNVNRTGGAGIGSPGRVFLGANGAAIEPLDGAIAEVLIFNKALGQADLDAVTIYLDGKYGTIDPNLVPRTFNPSPKDGQDLVPTAVTLSWSAPVGVTTPTYDVWFGPAGSLTFRGNQSANTIGMTGLAAGATYQWRIDVPEVTDPNSGEPISGYVWSFKTIPPKAHSPSPQDGAVDVPQNVILSWGSGIGAESHDIYLSTVKNEVVTGAAFVENRTEASFDPVLAFNTTYYWRIDEHVGTNIYQGDIWSFTVGLRVCSQKLLGDVNDDCLVNMEDLAVFAADWLKCVLTNGDCP